MSGEYSDTIELGQLGRTIARGWKVVVGLMLLGAAGALAVIAFAPRKFTGVGSIVLKSASSTSPGSSILAQVTGLGDVTSGLLGGKSQLETEIEVLSSRAVVGEVVDSLLLQARIDGTPRVASRNALATLRAEESFKRRKYTFRKVADGSYEFKGKDESGRMTLGEPVTLKVATLTFSREARLPSKFNLDLRDREDAIDRTAGSLDIEKKKGELVTVAFAGDDSLSAARVPNTLLQTYLRRRRGIDRGVNQRRVEFLTAKSDTMARDLALAASALRKQQESSGILDATATAKVSLEGESALREKLTDVLVEEGALQQLMTQVNAKKLNPRQLAAYPTFLRSPTVNNIVSQLSDVETRRTLMLRNRTEHDEEVVALARSAENLERQLIPYATTYAEALEKQRVDLETAIGGIQRELLSLPRAAESGSQLKQRVEDLAKLSGALQAQLVEAKLAAIGEGGDLSALDVAVPPKKPSFPKPVLTLAAGIGGGLVFGLVAALLVGSLGRWLGDAADIERTTGVPALQLEPTAPLLLSGTTRTIMVAPIDAGIGVSEVVHRLAQTAASRSVSSVALTLADDTADANASIARLEQQYDFVIVQLPSLTSNAAAATLQPARPVLLVTSDRVDRRQLLGSVQLLKRLNVPCAGIVMTRRLAGKVMPNERALEG